MSDIYLSDELQEVSNASVQEAGGSFETRPESSSNQEDSLKESLKKTLNVHNREELRRSIVLLKGEHGQDRRPFSSYRFYPSKTNFFNKDPNEKVILLLRKHPITNLPWIMSTFVLIITPAFLSVLSPFDSFPFGFKLIFMMGWYLMTFAYLLENFLSWFFNVNIITDERIFDVDFKNLIYREITDAEIDQIQDVTVKVGSAIRTVFNYGNISIQTAAEIPQLEFEAVPHPDKVARILRELRIEEEIETLEGRIR